MSDDKKLLLLVTAIGSILFGIFIFIFSEQTSFGLYGGGLILTLWFFIAMDRFALKGMEMADEIKKGNVAYGLALMAAALLCVAAATLARF